MANFIPPINVSKPWYSGLKSLAKSRKFWLAVFGVVQTVVLAYVQVDPKIWASIDALVGVLIAGIAAEDVAAKL